MLDEPTLPPLVPLTMLAAVETFSQYAPYWLLSMDVLQKPLRV